MRPCLENSACALVAALLLEAPPFWAARGRAPPPFPRPATAFFSSNDAASVLLIRIYPNAASELGIALVTREFASQILAGGRLAVPAEELWNRLSPLDRIR